MLLWEGGAARAFRLAHLRGVKGIWGGTQDGFGFPVVYERVGLA